MTENMNKQIENGFLADTWQMEFKHEKVEE